MMIIIIIIKRGYFCHVDVVLCTSQQTRTALTSFTTYAINTICQRIRKRKENRGYLRILPYAIYLRIDGGFVAWCIRHKVWNAKPKRLGKEIPKVSYTTTSKNLFMSLTIHFILVWTLQLVFTGKPLLRQPHGRNRSRRSQGSSWVMGTAWGLFAHE